MGMRSFLFVLACLATALPAGAQFWVRPAPQSNTPTLCAGCRNPATNLPVAQFLAPIAAHAGRYVDSTTTPNVQNLGMRTVRARRIRVNRERNRIYIGLGEAVGIYKLDQFFTTTLRRPLETMQSLAIGRAIGGRVPLESVAVPWQFFYAESVVSGWTFEAIDIQETLNDFDGDDRGYLYVGTAFGWGIGKENDTFERVHVDHVIQAQSTIRPMSVFSLKTGGKYYAVIAEKIFSAGAHVLYDVTNPAAPIELVTRRNNDKHGIVAWQKYESSQRLALLNTDGRIRIYDYAAFVADTGPVVEYTPAAGKRFESIAFDDGGTLWFTESTDVISSNQFHRATPSGNGYTKQSFNFDGPFSPRALSAGGGWVAIGGKSQADPLGGDMRLYKLVNGVPTIVSENGFFRRFYDVPAAGMTAPTAYAPYYIGLHSLQVVAQGGKTYLMYSTLGLGDAFELGSGDARIATSIALRTELAANNVQLIATVTASSLGTAPLSGVVTITKNGAPFTGAAVSGTNDPKVFIVNIPRTDLTTAATLAATYEGDTRYAPSGPISVNFSPVSLSAPTSFNAVATSPSTIQLTWDPVPSANEYEILRKDAATEWAVLTTTSAPPYNDVNVVANKVYLYRVRAKNGTNSVTELASTHVLSDEPLVAGARVKALHLAELRNVIVAARAAAGMQPFAFSDPVPAKGQVVRKRHIEELRTACAQLRAELGLAPLAGAVVFSRADLVALRNGVR
jgi:hypothetical protein